METVDLMSVLSSMGIVDEKAPSLSIQPRMNQGLREYIS